MVSWLWGFSPAVHLGFRMTGNRGSLSMVLSIWMRLMQASMICSLAVLSIDISIPITFKVNSSTPYLMNDRCRDLSESCMVFDAVLGSLKGSLGPSWAGSIIKVSSLSLLSSITCVYISFSLLVSKMFLDGVNENSITFECSFV